MSVPEMPNANMSARHLHIDRWNLGGMHEGERSLIEPITALGSVPYREYGTNMADATVIVEGKIKFREGKKWKPRWCILKKPSPVADRLQVYLYKDLTEFAKNESKPKAVFALDGFFGLDAGFAYDRELHVLALICHKNISLMAFELRENMIQFEIKIRQNMGEEHQFPVKVVKAPSSARLPKDPIRLMIHSMRFCLIAHVPPKILISWNIEDLRRFGTREGKFCFEGGTRCGKGSGVFALQSEQAEDIADIVNLASTGKLVNCHRKFKNRSSQIDFNSHLIADMSSSPSSSSIRHPHHPDIANRAPPPGALPVTLNCCHDSQTGSAESEDWSWYKRHSVSVMDHRRITALREKGFTDNREQLVVGIYDVPPKQERRIDDNSWDNLDEPNYSYPRPDPENLCTASSSSTSICLTPTSNSAVLSCGHYGNYKRIIPTEREYVNSDSSEQRQAAIYKWQSASTELLDGKVSSLNEMVAGNGQKDSSCKNSLAESLRHLKEQESDLQMEMVLLDEILQNCSVTSLEFSDDNSHSEINGTVQHLSESGRDQNLRNISSEPTMSEHSPDFAIISGNISFLKSAKSDLVQNSNFRKLDRTAVLKLNTSMPEGTPVSPLFYAKFNNIPPTSHLNAPLPYVNLSRYDDESYSHVHLPGSADSVPVIRMSNVQVLQDGQNHGLRERNFSLTSLHTPISTSNLLDVDYHGQGRNQMFQDKMVNKAALFTSSSTTQVQQWEQTDVPKPDEILVVKMNNQYEYPDQNVYKSRRPLLQNFGGISQKVHSDIVNILTTDAKLQDERVFSANDIYENLPIRNDDTLPPELPPKGPALLKRLKNTNKCTESEKTSHPMRYQRSQGVRKDIDARNYRADSHAHHMVSDRELQPSTDTREDNYLIMGSPKIKHKELAVTANESFDTSFARSQCENDGAVNNELYGRDIICVRRIDCSHDDEIYLDMESNQELYHQDLYISEADLKLSPMANSRMLEESTYMEMANVANKKSLLLKQLETPQTLMMSVTHSEENAYFINSPLSRVPPPPPRSLSLKIRHNSDSGVSPKPHELSVPDEQRDNRPKNKPIKSPTRVYTKIKKTSLQGQVTEPPMPFPNLIDFSKKMSDSRSTYVNTCLDVDKNLVPQEVYIHRDVPLPEPVKEGFLARFKRRSSRDKNAAQANDKYANSKIRNSVLERSMSEHDSSKATKEEKSSRLKVGRRRSSSFPNQLSYQESLDTSGDSMLKQAASSSSSFSSASSRPKPDQSESSSVRDFSDDSDMSPLLKRGDKSIDQQQLTVLHVRTSDQYPISPYIQACKSPIKINQLYADSSKTDDEKLIEIIQQKGQSKKPIVYQRSSSLELKKPSQEHEHGFYLKLPISLHRKERRSSFEKVTGCSSSCDSDIPYTSEATRSLDSETSSCTDRSKMDCLSLSFSLDKEQAPPALPPKTRPYQGPLSPVIEVAPLIPVQTEPIYVEMDKFVSSSDVGASRDKAHTANHNRPAEEDKDCNTNISNVETKAGRLSQLGSYEMSNEISYSSVIVCINSAHLAQNDHDDETLSDVSPTACTSSHHIINVDDISECANPAKTILRPRSGQEYVFIQRISVTSPVSFSCLPTNSSFVNSVFSELQKPSEELSHPEPPYVTSGHSVSSHYLSIPRNTPQKSPSTSSGKETVRSSASMHSASWEPDPSHHRIEGRSQAKAVADTSSPASTPHPVFSPHQARSVSPTKWKSAHSTRTEDSIFFPVYMTFSATTPPASPLGPYVHTTSAQHTPTYVNQEFVNRHNHASSSSHTVDTSGSYSGHSPIRTGVHSLKSFIFKDSSRRSPRESGETRIRSRHSESDANNIEKLSLSLPSSKHNQTSVSSSVHRSHSDPKRSETEEKMQLPSGMTSSNYRELPQKVYDKFANSSIISRRRRRYIAGNKLSVEAALINSSAEPSLKDISQEHSPVLKSSGYKNIDSINAATMAAISSPSPRTPSSGLDAVYLCHTSQLGSILESRLSFSEMLHSSGSSVFVDRNRHSASFVFNGGGSDTIENSVYLPHSSSPPPPLPWRKRISSSPVSSCSLISAISSSDVSDSPPSYFAPSPPCTPPPPPLPPRMPQSPPIVMVTSGLIEPETASHFSDEEQELNYIEIDMTKSAETVVLPPPLAYSRRSKRVRQQKEKDYAKLRYAVIDHRATKALQQARQEHEQCRDSSLWHVQPKDANLERGAGHLSRINSAPASSKRKQISVMQRERKLSSGSIESC